MLTGAVGSRIQRAITELSDRYPTIYATHAPFAWQRGLRHHTAILEAVRTFDPHNVGHAFGHHLAYAARALIQNIDPAYTPHLLNQTLHMIGSPDQDEAPADAAEAGALVP
ncbi:hypothetical protein ACWEO2_36345 [Nocardia sp. NPDC004278]